MMLLFSLYGGILYENNQNDGNAITLVLSLQPIKRGIISLDSNFKFRILSVLPCKNANKKTNREERELTKPTLDKT